MQHDNLTPPNCFSQAEITALTAFEGQILTGVNYYLWLDLEAGNGAYRFLYALELLFASGETLLLSAGEDTEAIRVISAETLIQTAKKLHELHGQPTIQRLIRDGQGVWAAATGQTLRSIQLARSEEGLFLNDALMLSFDTTSIVVELPDAGEGLEIREL
jgi:hypothetical protein